MPRVIMHLDLDAFFCAVEELRQPSLRGKAFVVGGQPDQRGVVASASYPARKFGVRNAMPTSQALRLCPHLIIVPGSHGVYGEHSKRVMAMLADYADAIEQISIDEAFFDMSDAFAPGPATSQTPRVLALDIQARIKASLDLPASLGVATSKLVAKMASGRAKPNGVLVIEPGREAEFLAPMHVGELWGVGKVTAERLNDIGITTIGQLQASQPSLLRRVFGNTTNEVLDRARGVDFSPVQTDRTVKSISEERTFARDVSDRATLRKMLLSLSDEVAARLREHGLFARTIQLKLRWRDFTTITRQTTLDMPTQLGDDIFAAVDALWLREWRTGQQVRLLGVGVSGFGEGQQLSLFEDDDRQRRLALARTLDELHKQYGHDAVTRASLR